MKDWMLHLNDTDRRRVIRMLERCLTAIRDGGPDVLTGNAPGSRAIGKHDAFVLGRRRPTLQLIHTAATPYRPELMTLTLSANPDEDHAHMFRMCQQVRACDSRGVEPDPDFAMDTLTLWRDRLSTMPDTNAVERSRRFLRDLTNLAQAAAHTLDAPWTDGSFGQRDFHFELGLDLRGGREPEQLRFKLAQASWRTGGMTPALAGALEALLSKHDHVTAHATSEAPYGLDVRVGPPPVVTFRRLGDALSTLRAIAALPAGAELLLPTG